MTTKIKKRTLLENVEYIGNKLPSPAILFLYILFVTWIISWILSYYTFNYFHPTTGEQIKIINMLAPREILTLFTLLIKNFVDFPPLGMIVVMTIGVGIAEGSGFLKALIQKMLSITSNKVLTPAIVAISLFSHIAADSCYVLVPPLAALMFYVSGRHPIAGITASFAGLSGGFVANYVPTTLDPLMQSFTQSATNMLDSSYKVNILSNYFFALGATFTVIGICWYITDKIIEPRLNKLMPVDIAKEYLTEVQINRHLTPIEEKGFRVAILTILVMVLGLFALSFPENSMMRNSTGSLTAPDSPLMQIIVPVLFMIFAIPGYIYGKIVGTFKTSIDLYHAMVKVVELLSGFLVFSFFCAQFLYVFAASNIGTLIAISGAEFLKSMNTPPSISILGIIFLTGVLNIFITSASSKWAVLSPIFVPMLMSVGIAPDLTQAAYRISDSAINISTPMLAYYPLIISYCQKYCKNVGIGTLISLMLPYSIGLLIVLTLTLFLFWGFNIPLGIDASYVYPRM